jgi:signal transduction histidine kinase
MGYQGSVEDMHDHLWEAVRSGLIFRADNSYGFLHDRVQEAAYSLIPKELRAEAHLRIGMLLAEHTPAEKREEAIFEIVNQLNRGSHLIASVEDRERVAELNLIAGRRAKLSTAYDSALKYLGAGRALLAEETWERNHQLIFSIERLTAECELLTVTVGLAAGDQLAEVQKECENGLTFARRVRFGLIIERCGAQLGLILTLRGLTATFGCLDHEGYSELDTERRLANSPNLVLAEFYYWTRKLQAHFFAGDLASAVDASLHAGPLLWTSAAMFESAEYRLYGALAHAAIWDHVSPEQRPRHFDSVLDHHRQLQVWAEVNPETFEDRAALVGAEIARIEGRVLNAQELYDKAIREAHKYGFVHNQAIANEIAGRFYAERGYETIAATYLRAARACYLRWGADGKVRQLEALYPHLKVDKSTPDSTATIVTPIEQLDLATVIRVSEAVSGEIVFEKLINTLMSSAIEHAGADRGLLILSRGDEYGIEAVATTGKEAVTVSQRQASITSAELPESVLRYVIRTHEAVIIDDVSVKNPFSMDDYIARRNIRSALCLPLLKQTKLIGILYLENNLTPYAFTGRIGALRIVASQAAISLENARSAEALAKARSELAHVNRVAGLGVLTASIAHEVNQPLAAIITNGETSLRWLTRDNPNIEKVRTFTERVVAEARRASEIIERIRGMASQRAPEHKLLSIDDVISESLSFLRHELLQKGIVVSLDLARELPQIVGDRTQLQQVIVNLTMNAVQAMTQVAPADRRISLRTMLAGPERVYCSIEDSGPGIDPEHLPRLFDSFFTTKDAGMGMGLAICQSIIEAHGGSLRADNNSSLGGARFSFGLLTADAQ